MATPRRTCEMKIPEDLVELIEASPGGMKEALLGVEREFGLRTSSSYIHSKNYFIIGPNPDAIELAIETLKQQYGMEKEEETKGPEREKSNVKGQLSHKHAVWKFQGDYAVKAGHLFRPELEQLLKVDSANVKLEAGRLEITCSYDDLETFRPMVDKLLSDIDSLHEEQIIIPGPHVEHVRLHSFLARKERSDRTVVFIWRPKEQMLSVFGKTEVNVKKALADWTMGGRTATTPRDISPSPTYSTNASLSKNEFKFPGGVLHKLESQRCGIQCVIEKIQKEFGLHVSYVRKKHLVIMGPHLDLLELAAQSIIHRYVLKSHPETGIVGKLEGKNAVWRFLGTYARKVYHLFQPELKKLQRIRTVTIKPLPSKANPTSLDILCSYRRVPMVKTHVEKIVGLVHTLYEKDVKIHKTVTDRQIAKLREYIQQRHEVDKTVLCVYEEAPKQVHVYSRHEGSALQTWGEIEAMTQRPKDRLDMPDEYWHMYRQLYQMKVSGEVVQKLEQTPRGIMALIQRIEKEYGVKTIYHRNKQMILISPTPEVLELANETIASRYVIDDVIDETEEDAGGSEKEDNNVDKINGNESVSQSKKTGRSRKRYRLPKIVRLSQTR